MTIRNVLVGAVALGVFSSSGVAIAEPRGAVPVDAKEGKAAAKAPKSFPSQPAPGTKARCAVTDEDFTVSKRTQFTTHEGRVYAFCCADCKPDFDKNPGKYADKK